MQAIIITTEELIYTDVRRELKFLVKIGGKTILERLLEQLSFKQIDNIVVACNKSNGDLVEALKSYDVSILDVENDSTSIAQLLKQNDSIILKGNVLCNNSILKSIVESNEHNIVVADNTKHWMTGLSLQGKKLKTVGIYRLDRKALSNIHNLDVLIRKYKERFADFVLCEINIDSVSIIQPEKDSWHEINDIQDIDLATAMFEADEYKKADLMLGRWGGYWRYPDYLDYFYLVTPYYPTHQLIQEIKDNFNPLLEQYPSGMRINALLAAKEFNVEPENIIVGNGAAELIKSMMSTLKGKTGFIRPTFDEYPNRLCPTDTINLQVDNENFTYDANDIIGFFDEKEISNLVIVNPDNPSGNYIDKKDMRKILEWTKEQNIKLIIDESFVDFVDEEDPTLVKQLILNTYPNLYVIKSISKSYGVPGLRLGILASGDKEQIAWMKKDVSIWNINSFAEFYMQIASKYKKDYIEALAKFREERNHFVSDLSLIQEIRVIPTQANYVMVELDESIDANHLKTEMLLKEKVFIKTLDKKINGGRHYLRLAIRNREDNNHFIEAFSRILKNIHKKEME